MQQCRLAQCRVNSSDVGPTLAQLTLLFGNFSSDGAVYRRHKLGHHSGCRFRCSDVIMGAMASQITSLMIVYSAVYSGADQRKYQSSASLAFVRGNSQVTGEFPAQRASDAENVSISWRHHIKMFNPVIMSSTLVSIFVVNCDLQTILFYLINSTKAVQWYD